MTTLTWTNLKANPHQQQQQQGFSHLMGPLLRPHQPMLGKGCVTGCHPTPCARGCCSPALLKEADMPGRWRHALPEAGVDSSHLTAHLHLPSRRSGELFSVKGINSLHWTGVCKNAVERRVFGGSCLCSKTPKKGGVLAMLWTPAVSSWGFPAALKDWKGTSLPWRGMETEAGGFRAQKAVKWWTLGLFNHGGLPNCLLHSWKSPSSAVWSRWQRQSGI